MYGALRGACLNAGFSHGNRDECVLRGGYSQVRVCGLYHAVLHRRWPGSSMDPWPTTREYEKIKPRSGSHRGDLGEETCVWESMWPASVPRAQLGRRRGDLPPVAPSSVRIIRAAVPEWCIRYGPGHGSRSRHVNPILRHLGSDARPA